ncbi:unnamed protein product [Sphagnum balticum]
MNTRNVPLLRGLPNWQAVALAAWWNIGFKQAECRFSGLRIRGMSTWERLQLPRNRGRTEWQIRQPIMSAPTSALISRILALYPLRRCLLGMLRPMDIISLATAAGIELTDVEKKKYLVFWKQMFFDMNWLQILRENSFTATIMGNDIRRLYNAIQKEDYTIDPSLLKLVIVICETKASPASAYRESITASFDTTTAWHETPRALDHVFEIQDIPTAVRTCVVTALLPSCIDVDSAWSRCLSIRSGPQKEYLTRPGNPWPSSFDPWGSVWQQFSDVLTYHPTRMPGEIDKPDVVDKYRMRIFYSRNGGCGAVFMRNKKQTSYRPFWLMADLAGNDLDGI